MLKNPKPPRKPGSLKPGELRLEVFRTETPEEMKMSVNQWLQAMYKKHKKFKIVHVKQSESQVPLSAHITISILYSRS